MKYLVIKDCPGFKAGEIIEPINYHPNPEFTGHTMYSKNDVDCFPEYFQPMWFNFGDKIRVKSWKQKEEFFIPTKIVPTSDGGIMFRGERRTGGTTHWGVADCLNQDNWEFYKEPVEFCKEPEQISFKAGLSQKDVFFYKIKREIYKVLEKLGAEFDLLGTINSWREEIDDDTVLANLKGWNQNSNEQGDAKSKRMAPFYIRDGQDILISNQLFSSEQVARLHIGYTYPTSYEFMEWPALPDSEGYYPGPKSVE